MKIYIDSDFKCYPSPVDGLREVETDFFDGKCRAFIEGYRFIPDGERWTREDSEHFSGEMIAPFRDYGQLADLQEAYEEAFRIAADAYAEGVNEA